MTIGIYIVGHLRDSLTNDLLFNLLKKFDDGFNKNIHIFIETWHTYDINSPQMVNRNDIINYFHKFNHLTININQYSENIIKNKYNKGGNFMHYLNYRVSLNASQYYFDAVIRIRPDIQKFIGILQQKRIDKFIYMIKNKEYLNNSIIGLLYTPGEIVGDCFYCMETNKINVFHEYLYHNFDNYMIKMLPFQFDEFGFKECLKDIGIINIKCTDNNINSNWYKFLYSIIWLDKQTKANAFNGSMNKIFFNNLLNIKNIINK